MEFLSKNEEKSSKFSVWNIINILKCVIITKKEEIKEIIIINTSVTVMKLVALAVEEWHSINYSWIWIKNTNK